MSEQHKNLAWIDLETTGLSPAADAILEIGVVITDMDLNVVNQRSWVCNPAGVDGRRGSVLAFTEITPHVWEMHTKNGLWRLSQESLIDLTIAQAKARRFIGENDAAGSPACGGSVHFDRAFLKCQAPLLDSVFHYRNLDVSSIRNVFKFFVPNVYEKSLYVARTGENKEPEHRALDDLAFSIRELKFFLNYLNDTGVDSMRQALAFAASVIKSGEGWTIDCERTIGEHLR